MWVDI